jgi:two-component system response regulator AlgR
MRVLIIDDEAPARDRLRRLVEEIGGHQVIGEAVNGSEALTLAARDQPEILLLDIRMPGMDGLEAARHLAQLDNPPAVIFTTAYDDHALEAFAAHAVDYLLKPIRKERLAQALTQARRLTRAQCAALGEDPQTGAARTHICARVRNNLELVPVEEILYFQADQKYVSVRHAGGEVLIEDSLKALEGEFGDRFSRIHRNALVCDQCILGLEKDAEGQVHIRLRGTDRQLEVSRRHLVALRRKLKHLRI